MLFRWNAEADHGFDRRPQPGPDIARPIQQLPSHLVQKQLGWVDNLAMRASFEILEQSQAGMGRASVQYLLVFDGRAKLPPIDPRGPGGTSTTGPLERLQQALYFLMDRGIIPEIGKVPVPTKSARNEVGHELSLRSTPHLFIAVRSLIFWRKI